MALKQYRPMTNSQRQLVLVDRTGLHKGGQIARSAGTYAQYLGRDQGYATMRLHSGEVRRVPLTCMATVGAVSNPDHMNEVLAKAGRNVWKGKRPHVRSTAMNPIDHPH